MGETMAAPESLVRIDGPAAEIFSGDWETVPAVVRGVAAVARILNRSTRAIEADLALGRMRPAPRPRETPRSPWSWSKTALRAHVDGPLVPQSPKRSTR